MRDLFEKIYKDKGPLGKWASQAEGYFVFPKLEGQISNRMKFQGKDVITWSINDYLGLANHPEVRKVDTEASDAYGSAYPMGARMMSGHTALHEQLQQELAAFVNKEAAYVLNLDIKESCQPLMLLLVRMISLFMMLMLMLVSLMVYDCTWGSVLPISITI